MKSLKEAGEEISVDLSPESDPQKIAELSQELNDAMLEDERLKTRARLRGSPLYVSSRWRIVT